MLIALPTTEGKLCPHFGHCEKFTIFEVNPATNQVVAKTIVTPPPHEPGLLPKWLTAEGVTAVITGGMGERAQSLFAQTGVKVVLGAQVDDPDEIVKAYLNGTLEQGSHTCDHVCHH